MRGERVIGQGSEGIIEDNAFCKRSAKPTESLQDAERDMQMESENKSEKDDNNHEI